VAKPELGNKHQCQHCGTKFFDLNRVPITCPKCGTIFHAAPPVRSARSAASDEDDAEAMGAADLVSLEDAEVDADKIVEDVDDDVEIEVADDDTFLEEEEEDDDDVVDLIDGDREDDEER
jgi:uncharacterized protein (TIGR02300 family)